jgi:hypothetical protein
MSWRRIEENKDSRIWCAARVGPNLVERFAWGMGMQFVWGLALALALAAPAAADELPNVFMIRLFGTYMDRAHWAKHYTPCDEFCEPGFAKLIKKLDYDPVCQCRSGGGDYIILAGKLHKDGSFEYTLRDAKNPRRNRQWILILHPAGASWKIYDVWERRLDDKNSLRDRLAHGGSGMLL